MRKLMMLLAAFIASFLISAPVRAQVAVSGHVQIPSSSARPNTVAISFVNPQAGTANVVSVGNRIFPSSAGLNILPLNNVFTENNSFLGTSVLKTINSVRYVSQFPGGDLGAKINAAVTDCVVNNPSAPCKYVLDMAGTISTPPNLPMGSVFECNANQTVTLSTTWNISHRGTLYNFNGCQFNFTLDARSLAFNVSKNSFGTVNTSGSTVTFVSGTDFTNMDPGDGIIINGGTYNIATVTPPNRLTVTSSVGTLTGVRYAGALVIPAVLSPLPTVTINDLSIAYAGAGTTSNTGFQLDLVSGFIGRDIHVRDFASGLGLSLIGSLSNSFQNLYLGNNLCQGILDQSTFGGATITSNLNRFMQPVIVAGGHCPSNISFDVDHGSFGNVFDEPDFEGNAAEVTLYFQNGAFKNTVRDGDFEVNGDGTTGSADITFDSGSGNLADSNRFATLTVNRPAIGILCAGASTVCTLNNNVFGPGASYTNAWNFISSATGSISGNSPGSAGHGDPASVQDMAGNVIYASLTDSGLASGSVSNVCASTLGRLEITGCPTVIPPISASLTTTSATTDNLTITGMTSSGHCSIAATNASAATNIATTFISAKTTNQITVTHVATRSMTYDFVCTPN